MVFLTAADLNFVRLRNALAQSGLVVVEWNFVMARASWATIRFPPG